jgi:exodeoxyribonuclease V alpha subunit
MASVLDAVPTGGHVLLVGDPNQLPPVGPGAPLRDMVAAGVPRGELSQVRRNAGSIVHACLRIKNGESFETVDQVDIDAEPPPQNLKLIETRSDGESGRALVEVLKRMSRFHPLWQTQVVVARNKSGDVSREKLNELLQPILNPDGRQLASNPFRVGDKIICTRNSDMKAVQADYDTQNALDYHDIKDDDGNPEQVYIANGEIGRVVAISERVSIARFSEGDTLVRIPMGKQKQDDDSDEGGQGCNFDLAFAVTCHRLQGSEAPCVIVMGDEGGGMIASREWIYTAISRASKLCILIGKMSTFDRMRSRVVLTKRKTFLVELIQSLNSGETHAG